MSSIFSDAALRQYTDAVAAQIPPGKHGALIGWATTDGKWRVTAVQRIGEHWQLAALLEGDVKAGKVQGGVQVIGSW